MLENKIADCLLVIKKVVVRCQRWSPKPVKYKLKKYKIDAKHASGHLRFHRDQV